jgi:hypothetical protein
VCVCVCVCVCVMRGIRGYVAVDERDNVCYIFFRDNVCYIFF